MTFKLGELASNVEVLRSLRDTLAEDGKTANRKRVEVERWKTLSSVAADISEACESQDLEKLASSVRQMKNRLRRPSIRKELARMEAEEDGEKKKPVPKKEKPEPEAKGKEKEKVPAKPKDTDENPTGHCKCADCGKTIDGSKEPCVDDALCIKCAMKSKVIAQRDKDKAKRKKAVPMAGMGGMGGGMGGEQQPGGQEPPPDDEKAPAESVGLRRRNY